MPRGRRRTPGRPPGSKPRSRSEWVGGCFPAPGHVVGEGEAFRPLLATWIELPSGLIVGNTVVRPDDREGALAQALTEALDAPLAGPPRTPAAIRVADAALEAEIRTAIGDRVPVTVAPTPEIDQLAAVMLQSFGEVGEDDPDAVAIGGSYLGDGRIEPALVAELFRSALPLQHAQPWTVLDDQDVLRLDIPALDVEGACVSVIGAMGESLGLLIFPSHDSFLAFLDAAASARPETGRLDLGTTWLALTLAPVEELTPVQRREVDEHGWAAPKQPARAAPPDETLYPMLDHRERDGLPRPLTEHDHRVASACASALAAFFVMNREKLEADEIEPLCQSFTDDNDLTVRLTWPYEAFELFDVPAT